MLVWLSEVTISDATPGGNGSAFTPSYAIESWCHDATNPVAVASVDLNTPCEHPSAIAVVSVAPTAAEHVEVATCGGKGGGKKGAKLGIKSISAPTSPSELRGSKELTCRGGLGVQKGKWSGKRPVSQRENHIWSERQRRKGMNYLFSTLRSLLPHPTSKVPPPPNPLFLAQFNSWFQLAHGYGGNRGCWCRRINPRWSGRSSSTSSRCK